MSAAIVFTITASVFTQTSDRRARALEQLVATERAFAKSSVENGVRNSFIQYFAEDGINFQPNPTRTKEAMQKRPEQTKPFAYTLNWEPVFADVSRSGDLGYTTGPFTLKQNATGSPGPDRGYYFTIWKRQTDGLWKVVVDCGIGISKFAGPDPTLRLADESDYVEKSGTNVLADIKKVNDIEGEFLGLASSGTLAEAYSKVLASQSRLHRNDLMPITGKQDIVGYVAAQNISVTWKPLKADVAASRDLAYTYGSYESHGAAGSVVETGYYVHVWKREKNGAWKLAIDTTNPLPSKP